MEPSEAQYLIINALHTLDLLGSNFYDEDTGDWGCALKNELRTENLS